MPHKKEYSLPSSTTNENLETISRNKLALLFDPSNFELRSENQRDKGVDLIIELKQNGVYTNFRFAVQVKSSISTKKNKDGSFSYPIEVSNINYLLNYPMPAYYIIYDHASDAFYYEQAFLAYKSMIYKHFTTLPKEFKIRFSKLLTQEAINDIYKSSLANGNLLRKLNPHLTISSSKTSGQSGISIDENNEVYSVEQNIAYINQFGLKLIDKGAYGTIIEIEQKTHPRNIVSPVFNLTCGLAYFYQGKIFKALDFLRAAQTQEQSFSSETRALLTYTVFQAKHDLGILDTDELKSKIQMLLENDGVGSFLEMEKAWKELTNREGDTSIKIQTFYTKLKTIVDKEHDRPKARTTAYGMILDAEKTILFRDFVGNFSSLIVVGNHKRFAELCETWTQLEQKYLERLDRLMEYASGTSDLQAMGNISRMKIEWHYQIAYACHFFDNWSFSELKSTGEFDEETKLRLLKDCEFLDRSIKHYKTLTQEENLILCLKLKYQILHFLKEYDRLEEIKNTIKTKVEENDFVTLGNRFNAVINQGTEHEKFTAKETALLIQIYTIAEQEGIESFLIERSLEGRDINLKWSIDNLMNFEFPEIEK
jgi:hypothetical protein